MATITIRNLPDAVAARVKTCAAQNGRSMEEEVRTLLRERYANRAEILERIRARWRTLPRTAAAALARGRREGRP